MVHHEVGMVLERQAAPLAGVHIDLEQAVGMAGGGVVRGEVGPVGADHDGAGRPAHAVERRRVHRGVDGPGLAEALTVGQPQRPPAAKLVIARHGDHVAVVVQHIVVGGVVHVGDRAAAPCPEVDPMQIDPVAGDVDAAHEQGVSVAGAADRGRAVKHRQHIRRAIQHLHHPLPLKIEHLAEEQFRPRHAQRADAAGLRGHHQDVVLADPAQVPDLDRADVAEEQAFARGHAGDGERARLACDRDAGDQLAAGRQLNMLDRRSGGVGLERRRREGRALGPGARTSQTTGGGDREGGHPQLQHAHSLPLDAYLFSRRGPRTQGLAKKKAPTGSGRGFRRLQ